MVLILKSSTGVLELKNIKEDVMNFSIIALVAVYLIWLGSTYKEIMIDLSGPRLVREGPRVVRIIFWLSSLPIKLTLLAAAYLWWPFWMLIPDRYCKAFRKFVRHPFGWKQISRDEYQFFVDLLQARALDYSHIEGEVGEGNGYPERYWDSGTTVLDTFTRADSDEILYRQRPNYSTEECWKKIRKTRRGARIKLIKEGWTEPFSGEMLNVSPLLGGGKIEFMGPSTEVVYKHKGVIDTKLLKTT